MQTAGAEEMALAVHRKRDGSLERMVKAYQDHLFSYARRMLGDAMEAQEVTQDAFLRAYDALTLRYSEERCRGLALRPWLYRITGNLARNRIRARGTMKEEPLSSHRDLPQRPVHSTASPGNAERLEHALALLPPRDRELILLRFMEDLPYAEIALAAGATEAAVRGKIFRAVGKLKKLLA